MKVPLLLEETPQYRDRSLEI